MFAGKFYKCVDENGDKVSSEMSVCFIMGMNFIFVNLTDVLTSANHSQTNYSALCKVYG